MAPLSSDPAVLSAAGQTVFTRLTNIRNSIAKRKNGRQAKKQQPTVALLYIAYPSDTGKLIVKLAMINNVEIETYRQTEVCVI